MTKRTFPALRTYAWWSRFPVVGPEYASSRIPNASWKYSAACVAFPEAQTTASQPVTGNGSPLMSWATTPVSLSVSVTSSLTVIGRPSSKSKSSLHQNAFGFL